MVRGKEINIAKPDLPNKIVEGLAHKGGIKQAIPNGDEVAVLGQIDVDAVGIDLAVTKITRAIFIKSQATMLQVEFIETKVQRVEGVCHRRSLRLIVVSLAQLSIKRTKRFSASMAALVSNVDHVNGLTLNGVEEGKGRFLDLYLPDVFEVCKSLPRGSKFCNSTLGRSKAGKGLRFAELRIAPVVLDHPAQSRLGCLKKFNLHRLIFKNIWLGKWGILRAIHPSMDRV